jgi:hypothetical protein
MVTAWWLCKISGMIDEYGQRKNGFPQPWEFRSKPAAFDYYAWWCYR